MPAWDKKMLLNFSSHPKDAWTIDDAMKGTSIIGGTGSGKTTGSGRAIALKFLEEGWGGLVLCAKKGEAKMWQEYCTKAGRENDVIVFGKNSVHKEGEHEGKPIIFNPLHYEMNRGGEGAGEAFNLTNIFMNLNKVRNRASNEGESKKDDMFWDNALKRIISRTIELITLAGEELTFRNMIDLIYTSPTEKNLIPEGLFNNFLQMVKFEDEHATALRKNFFLKCLTKVFNKTVSNGFAADNIYVYDSIDRYFTSSLPNMSGNTHNAIIESFMGVVEPFQSGILAQHFSGETNLFPEKIYLENKIIILDFPVKEYLDAGVMAQSIFKLIFQQAIERRDTDIDPNPVFLWVDEAQYFLNPYDQIFLTTARSSRTATVYLSQSISNYYVVMGAGQDAKPKVDSLMGNLSTKIFHANSDAETNEYASRLIGKDIVIMNNKSTSNSLFSFNVQRSEGLTEQYQPQVHPREFTILKTGGDSNELKVEAVIFATGKEWSDEKNFIKTAFVQDSLS